MAEAAAAAATATATATAGAYANSTVHSSNNIGSFNIKMTEFGNAAENEANERVVEKNIPVRATNARWSERNGCDLG